MYGTLILMGLLSSCQPYSFNDNVGSSVFDWNGQDDIVPYVLGTDATIRAAEGSFWWYNWDRWSMSVDDQTIFDVKQTSFTTVAMYIKGTAVGEGTTQVHLIDPDGDIAHSATITVALPDRIELHDHAPQLADMEYLDDVDGDRQLLLNNTTTFEVKYFHGHTRLYGNMVLSAAPDNDTEVATVATFLGEDEEWLQVTPTAVGSRSITFRVGGHIIDTFHFQGVTYTAVTDMEIHAQHPEGPQDANILYAIAWMKDAQGRPVHGGQVDWTIFSSLHAGTGDLFWYDVSYYIQSTLSATFGDVYTEVQVQGTHGGPMNSDMPSL